MKFACENCSTRYAIPEEKVAGRTLRVRCSRCRHVMEVVGPRAGTEPVAEHRPGQVTDPAKKAARRNADLATHRPLFSARGADPFAAAGGDGDSLWQMRGESDVPASSSSDGALQPVSARPRSTVPPPALPADASSRWYAAIKGQCRGPFTDEEMTLLAQRGRIHTRSRVWRGGMPEWVRVDECADLAFLRDVVRPRQASATPAHPVPAVGHAQVAPADEVSAFPVAGWNHQPGKPFSNLVASQALLTQPEETPPPITASGSRLPRVSGTGTGGTDWFVVEAAAIARVLEDTPDHSVPGTSAMITGVHVIRRHSPAVVLAAVAGALLVAGVLAILALPMLAADTSSDGPAVRDITSRSPVNNSEEIPASATPAQEEAIRALGTPAAAPVAVPAPAPVDAAQPAAAPAPAHRGRHAAEPLQRVRGQLERSAQRMFQDGAR